jgi:hypothetical protein
MAFFIAYLIIWLGLVYGSPSCESGDGSRCSKISFDTKETSFQTNQLKGFLENLEAHITPRPGIVNTNESLSKMTTMTERIASVFNNNATKGGKLNRLKSHLDSILKPLDPIIERIFIKMLSEPHIVSAMVSKLRSNDKLICSIITDSGKRKEIASRLERQSQKVITKRTVDGNHGNPSKATSPNCCDCLCDENSEKCSICLSEITIGDATLKLDCPHGPKFHDKVSLHYLL